MARDLQPAFKAVNAILSQILNEARSKLLAHPIGFKAHEITSKLASNPVFVAGCCGFVLGMATSKALSLTNAKLIRDETMKGVKMEGDAISPTEDLIKPRISKTSQVLIRVEAFSLDSTDLALTSGVPGRDFTGVLEEVGRDVNDPLLRVGIAVWGMSPHNSGCGQRYIVTDYRNVSRRPISSTLGPESLASLAHAGSIAHNVCLKLPEIVDSVLVVGAQSQIGCSVIQLIKNRVNRIVACSPHRATSLMRILGATFVIPLMAGKSKISDNEETCAAELLTHPPFDVVIIAQSGFVSAEFCRKYVKKKNSNRVIDGTKIRVTKASSLSELRPLVETNELRPILEAPTFDFDDLEAAVRHLEVQGHGLIGKVVITF